MRKIRVAVVGTGYFSPYHYEAWKRMDNVDLVAVVYASNVERAKEFAARFDIPEIHADAADMMDKIKPDLVDIVSTPESHLSLIRESCARKIATITQKPLAPTMAESIEITDIASESGNIVVVHENWRFKPWFREMARLVQTGSIGTPINTTFIMRPGDGRGPSAYMDRQPYFQKMPRLLMQETGIHVIDVFRQILGEIDGVSAHLRKLNPVIAGEDAGHVIFEFTNGSSGLLDANRHLDHVTDDIFRTMGDVIIEGTDATIMLDGFGKIRLRAFGSHEIVEHDFSWENVGYAGDCVYALQKHVVDHLQTGTPVENDVSSYMPNLWAVEASYLSSQQKRYVTLAEARAVHMTDR